MGLLNSSLTPFSNEYARKKNTYHSQATLDSTYIISAIESLCIEPLALWLYFDLGIDSSIGSVDESGETSLCNHIYDINYEKAESSRIEGLLTLCKIQLGHLL